MATKSEQQTAILNALSKGGLRAAEVVTKTKLDPDTMRERVQELMDSGKIVMEGNLIKLAAKKTSTKAPAVPAKTGKISRKPAPEPEEETYSQEDIDAMVEEYQTLGSRRVLNPAQKKRFKELEEELESLGVFDDEPDDTAPEEVEEGYTDEEVSDMVDEYQSLSEVAKPSAKQKARRDELEGILDELGMFGEDDAEDAEAAPEEEPDFFAELDEDEGEHGDDADDGSDENVAPVRGKKIASGDTGFTMSFKPVDQLTDKELKDRIAKGTKAAEDLADQGFVEEAELLMRSVTKCRKQLNRRQG